MFKVIILYLDMSCASLQSRSHSLQHLCQFFHSTYIATPSGVRKEEQYLPPCGLFCTKFPDKASPWRDDVASPIFETRQSLYQQTRKINSNFSPHQLLNHDFLRRSGVRRGDEFSSRSSFSSSLQTLYFLSSSLNEHFNYSQLLLLHGHVGIAFAFSVNFGFILGLGHFGKCALSRPRPTCIARQVQGSSCQQRPPKSDVLSPVISL